MNTGLTFRNKARNFSREYGPKAVTISKGLFIVCFIVLSIINKNTKRFKENPGRTVAEAILAGLCSAGSFTILGYMRGVRGSAQLNPLFGISFFIFMALQVLFELSGLNELKPVTTAARKLSNEENKLFAKTFVKIIFGIFIFMGIGFVYAAWDTPFPDMSTTRFCLEMCIIGLGAAIPSIMVTKDRGGSGGEVFTNFSSMFILFGLVAHPLMQYSGVYHELGFWKTPILATQSMGVGAS